MNKLSIQNVDQPVVSGKYVEMDGQCWYKISNSHRMPEFFISLVSSSDHWMFISSQGALTAGRRSPDAALFPYYSADKIVDMAACTGAQTIIRARNWHGELGNWEPFAGRLTADRLVARNVYKNLLGNQLCLEEINESLHLAFRYSWSFGDQFGFIRRCKLIDLRGSTREVSLLDGIQNLLPSGLSQEFQLRYSNLGDAYKKNERISDSQLGLFYLSSIPTDRAEPSEGLRTTTAWQNGLDRPTVLLSSSQLDRFRQQLPVHEESDVRARRGAYFVATQLNLNAGGQADWSITADVCRDHADVVDLHRRILDSPCLRSELEQDISSNERRLLKIVSSADGRQAGADRLRVHRHQSNVLFNVMRGGIPSNGYRIPSVDLRKHVQKLNVRAYQRNVSFFERLDQHLGHDELLRLAEETGDLDLIRIAREYLPLKFSRRHGDPTRPWNAFSINVLASDGSENLGYEGNWRDIFQNWEALSLAYPEFVPSMIFRFVNASTADGYNPYRITKDGFEYESPDPNDPWGNIGYWGDHQIIYLLKLLEWSRSFDPAQLERWLADPCCTYAQIPYRIRSYDRIRRNPQETIDFDSELAERIDARASSLGADGKLLHDSSGQPYHATLAEKLLVPALVKITNFVPGGGVWLNTQRPEWNDANNALVGNGLSVVTACYLRRYFAFMTNWFSSAGLPKSIPVSREVVLLLSDVSDVLKENSAAFDGPLSDTHRKQLIDSLSTIGSAYRQRLYEDGLSGDKIELPLSDCVALFQRALAMIDHTLRCNRRRDGLYHSYNLLVLQDDEAGVQPLYEMLEGQVAMLNSGLLSAEEAVGVLDALHCSDIYRADQQSYMLYPDRQLPRFLDKNALAEDSWTRSQLLQVLLDAGDTSIVRRDVDGGIHFNGDFRNVTDLNVALDSLDGNPTYAALVRRERILWNELFEQTFHHRDFTGRSGTFFGYEGLGSIYWHMVSKLSLATIENYVWAKEAADPPCAPDVLKRLRDHYREIRDGIGPKKSPEQYGAFPSDPYSHTPKHAGIQQPGMTGQVKEDILSRWAELGMRINGGILSFDPILFESSEFLETESALDYFDVQGRHVRLTLPRDSFAYTLCQIPVVYHRASERQLVVFGEGLEPLRRESLSLTAAETASVFARGGEVTRVEVYFNPEDCSSYVNERQPSSTSREIPK